MKDGTLFGTGWLRRLAYVATLALLSFASAPFLVAPLRAADPLRVMLVVDSSTNMNTMLLEFRKGLAAFVEALPADVEVALVSTGGQLRLRVPATTDRQKLRDGISHFASDGGANSLLDTLLESDKRWLRPASDRRPIFVVISTDQRTTGEPPIYAFNDFVKDFVRRRGRAHAVIIRGSQMGLASELLDNLTGNTDGLYTVIAVPNSLATRMQAIAAEVAAQQ